MMVAPTIEPRIVPTPPLSDPPPMTTAAMTSSSVPMATVGSPWRSRDICITPDRPTSRPARP
jgi:hypothetical protein